MFLQFPSFLHINLSLRHRKFQRTILAMMFLLFFSVVGEPIASQAQSTPSSRNDVAPRNRAGLVGNEACAKCHAEIYKSYEKTPMAHASGRAMDNLIPADFMHHESGVHYRVYAEAGNAWLSFDRDGPNPLHGKRPLLYYIGSGRRGLTYLFANDGFIFESPINWYGDRKVWDMTPAYQNATEMPLNLPALTSCLHCHVSDMRPPLDGTENRYAMPLLTHAGVSCERCHGPGEEHVKGGAIVNPAKLLAERRDAVCVQCHMEGRVSIERAGKHVYEYRPGDLLSDYIRYYVLAGPSQTLGAVSQVEALAESTCKRMSGDKMSCASCHDPHFSPLPAERVSYFRGKCLACHGAGFGAKHHSEQKDCTVCHMPALASKDVAHTEVTDHRIPRVPSASSKLEDASTTNAAPRLVPSPDSHEAEADLRDGALAWESLADSGVEAARTKAQELLRRSAEQFPNDAATLSAFGYEEQMHGDIPAARKLYQRALASDPNLIDAATNLGVIEAQAGDLPGSIELLRSAFDKAPGRGSIGLDLARVLCVAGEPNEARATIDRVLEFNPDMSSAREFQKVLGGANPRCD